MLSEQNIESELSYAYLHAVASRGGFSCTYSHRHLDNAGVDAIIHEDGRKLSAASELTSFEVHVQLKATYQTPTEVDGYFSFSLKVKHYNKLRSTRVNSPRILVVLYLPTDQEDWLSHTEDCLVAKRCAYWVSLKGAPASENDDSQTVYIPKGQLLSTGSLNDLMTRFSRREEVLYEGRPKPDEAKSVGDTASD